MLPSFHPSFIDSIHPSLLATNKVCEGYVFIPVCQSFCSQGGLTQCMLGYTPQTRGRHPPNRCRHPLQTRGKHPPRNRHPPGADTHPCTVHAGRYGQQAGGTHPTGMHTCSFSASIIHSFILSILHSLPLLFILQILFSFISSFIHLFSPSFIPFLLILHSLHPLFILSSLHSFHHSSINHSFILSFTLSRFAPVTQPRTT